MQDHSMEVMWSSGHLSGSNAEYVEELYECFLANPQSIPQQWRNFFESLPAANGGEAADVSHSSIRKRESKFKYCCSLALTAFAAIKKQSLILWV